MVMGITDDSQTGVPPMFRRDRNRGLDPRTDFELIYRNMSVYDFPWDITQALSFALFRTYAVPSVGRLLSDSRGFDDTQKRYDDTALLLEAPITEGFADPAAKAAIRRINQMHHAYDISNDDMRYVLATFVVVPKRWMDDYGWRQFTYDETVASVNYYRELARHMNIKDVPETYEAFEELLDSYEAEHFAFDEGGRRVADLTLELLTTFYPRPLAPLIRIFSYSLMDDPLLAAFHYRKPNAFARKASYLGMRARAAFVRALPPRRKPYSFHTSPRMKTYRSGEFAAETAGTFPRGCPVKHLDAASAPSAAVAG